MSAGVNPTERCQTETWRVGWSTETSLCSPAIRPFHLRRAALCSPLNSLGVPSRQNVDLVGRRRRRRHLKGHDVHLRPWRGPRQQRVSREGVRGVAELVAASETGRSCQLVDHAGRFRCGRSWAQLDFSDAALDDQDDMTKGLPGCDPPSSCPKLSVCHDTKPALRAAASMGGPTQRHSASLDVLSALKAKPMSCDTGPSRVRSNRRQEDSTAELL